MNMTIWQDLYNQMSDKGVALVAVSKKKPVEEIYRVYQWGQRDFGENYVQELLEKQALLPKDIRWHFIGHLQSNKVRYLAPFISLIHSIDKFSLLAEVQKQAKKVNRRIEVLLQLHIAAEETKFGFSERDIVECMDLLAAQKSNFQNICIRGMMGMASNTEDDLQIQKEFETLYRCFLFLKKSYFLEREDFNICSMGMSSDYALAIAAGSTMVRVGSLLFGNRD